MGPGEALDPDKRLPDVIAELLWAIPAQQPLMQQLWEAGDNPVEGDTKDLLALIQAFNEGIQAAFLRLAEEVEALKARQAGNDLDERVSG